MAGVTLDSGPLVLIDRGDDTMLAWLEVARQRGARLRTPAVAVAEVWRGGPRAARLARALAGVDVIDVDQRLARNAGILLGKASTKQRRLLAIDALVVACAALGQDLVLTTDPDDLGPLADAAGLDMRTP